MLSRCSQSSVGANTRLLFPKPNNNGDMFDNPVPAIIYGGPLRTWCELFLLSCFREIVFRFREIISRFRKIIYYFVKGNGPP